MTFEDKANDLISSMGSSSIDADKIYILAKTADGKTNVAYVARLDITPRDRVEAKVTEVLNSLEDGGVIK